MLKLVVLVTVLASSCLRTTSGQSDASSARTDPRQLSDSRELMGKPGTGDYVGTCSGGDTCAEGAALTAGGVAFAWYEMQEQAHCPQLLSQDECLAISLLDLNGNTGFYAGVLNNHPSGCWIRHDSTYYNTDSTPDTYCDFTRMVGSSSYPSSWPIMSCICKGTRPPPPTPVPTVQPTAPTVAPTTAEWGAAEAWWGTRNFVEYGNDWEDERNSLMNIFTNYGYTSAWTGQTGIFMAYDHTEPAQGPWTFGDYIELGYEPISRADCSALSALPQTWWFAKPYGGPFPGHPVTIGTSTYDSKSFSGTQNPLDRHPSLPPGCSVYIASGGGLFNDFWDGGFATWPTVAECAGNTDPDSVCENYDFKCSWYSCIFYHNPPPPPPPPTPSPTTCNYGELLIGSDSVNPTSLYMEDSPAYAGGSFGALSSTVGGAVNVGAFNTAWTSTMVGNSFWHTKWTTTADKWRREFVVDLGQTYDITHVMMQIGRVTNSYNGRTYDTPLHISVAGWQAPFEHTPPTSFADVITNGAALEWDMSDPGIFGNGPLTTDEQWATGGCENPYLDSVPHVIDTSWATWTGCSSRRSNGWDSRTVNGGNNYHQADWGATFCQDEGWRGVMPFKLASPTLVRYIAVSLNPCKGDIATYTAGLEYFNVAGSLCPVNPSASPSSAPTLPTASPSSSPTNPTASPSSAPTLPTASPSASPIVGTHAPTPLPTSPTPLPTTVTPTKSPTSRPSFSPTPFPTNGPTGQPTPHIDHHFTWAAGESHTDIALPFGSTVYFDYTSGHNVHTVETQAEYDNCDCSSSTEIAGTGDGPFHYTPATRKVYYFVCCQPGHCANGMKAKVSIGMTGAPTSSPTNLPTHFPTRSPTLPHTENPTASPSTSPSLSPTSPTAHPSATPSTSPTESPSRSPSTSPTNHPSESPTAFPTASPTTAAPTTSYPTRAATNHPTVAPTASPTLPTVVKANVRVSEEMSAEDQAASGATASEYDTECDPGTTDCASACSHSTATCSTNRRLDAHGRDLSGGTVTVVFDMSGGSAVYNAFKSAYNLQFSGAVYILEVEASDLSAALTTMSDALSTPPEILTIEIEDNGLTGDSVDEGLSFVAEALASDDVIATSAIVKQESNPAATITYCDNATPSDPCLCNPATQVRFSGACRVCSELNQYISDRCNTNDPMPNTALFPDTCTPRTCTPAPTMSPTYGAMCCQCMIERTSSPTEAPTTANPTTSAPSNSPTVLPSAAPSHSPSTAPSSAPTNEPTVHPTRTPTAFPTEVQDTEDPTPQPTIYPTGAPSTTPSHAPSKSPSPAPTGCGEDVKYCADGSGQRFRVLGKNCEFARCATYEVEDADADEFETIAVTLGVETGPIQFKDLFLDRPTFKNAAKDKKKKLKRNVLHRPKIRGRPLRIKKTDSLVRSFDNGGVFTTSQYKGSQMDFKAVDKPEFEGDEIVLTTGENYYFEDEASFKINGRFFDVTTTTLTESTGYHTTTYSERGTPNACTIDGAAGETMCSIDDSFRFVIYVVGSIGGGYEEGTVAPTGTPTTGAPTTTAPSLAPTTASPTISITAQINQMLALGNEIQLKTSGKCEDHSQCESLFYGEGYALCDGMAGQSVPTRYAALDFSSKEFKIISGTTKTRGCTLEGNYLVYNTNGNEDCSNDSQCICICNFFTASPTASPTKGAIADLECATPPQGFQGNEGAGVIDLAITWYDESTAQFTVDPYMNWDSAFLFYNNEGYPGYTTVSAWTTFTAVRDYPFHHLDDFPECRTRLKDSFTFDEIVVDPTNCANFTTHANGSTTYNFYLGTTTCYTNLTISDCSTSKFQHHAYKYADSFAYVENIHTSGHISQCRRTWQFVNLRVDMGGSVNVLPTASLAALMAVEQDDGGLIVPSQTEQHQIYGDIGVYTIVSSDWTQTVVSGNTITQYNVVNFNTPYQLNYQLDNFRKLGGKTLSAHIVGLYDTIVATVSWERLSCPQAGCPWVSMTDRYLHTTTFTYTDVRNFDMQFTITMVSQLFVEDNIRARVTVTWSDSTGRRRLTAVDNVYLQSSESALKNNFLLETYNYSHATPEHEIQYVEVENEDTLLLGFLITAGVIVTSVAIVIWMRNY